ncbi:MAG: AsmA family protein [Gammaproteobacteria bacterium]
MRTVKILAGLAGGIVVLVVAVLVGVWLFVNPNDYKGRIAAAVKHSTGRDLVLQGDIKLSVFPWVALELGPASLGNPPGFGEEPFLAFNHAAIRVRLMRLLHQRLDIDRVEIDGLDVRLRKNAKGTGNWENFGQTKEAEPKTQGNNASEAFEGLAGIKITNGKVSYPGLDIQKFNLETGAFGGSGATPISITFEANRGTPNETVSVNAKFDLSVDPDQSRFKLAAVTLSGLLAEPGDGRATHWEMSAPTMEADFTAQTAAVPAFAMNLAGAQVTGKLQATKLIDDMRLTGSATLSPLVLREFAPRLGVTLPKTRDPKALMNLSGSTDFMYGAGGMRLDNLKAQLDETHLKGSVALAGEPRAAKFNLNIDEIDVDRYMNPDPAPTTPAPKKVAETAEQAAAAKTMDADGTLTMGSVHFAPLDFTNVKVTLSSKDNVLHLYPAQASIDGGSYSGNITLDRRTPVPVLSMDEHLSAVDMARLLAATSYKGKLSGRGNVNLKASARGAELPAVMQSLNGHFDANLSDGAIEGVDIAYEIGMAQALVKHEAQPTRSSPPRTKFEACKLSAEITAGVAKTSDLTISTPVLKVTGQGTTNLVNKAIDFQMLASVLKAPGASVADIPLKITGTYVDPTVRPDVEALAKGQLKQKLQDVLKKNGLGGLFK